MPRANQKPCARAHCDRLVREGADFPTCTPACSVLHRFSTESDNIIELIGPGEHADQLREVTEDLVTCFDELLTLRRKIKSAASRAGVTNHQWSQILRGDGQ